MKESDEPRILFEQLAAIHNMFKDAMFKIQEEDLIAVVMEKAPAKYASILAMEQATKGDQLKLNDLSHAMTDLHQLDMSKLKLDSADKKKTGKELALAGADGGGGGPKCYTCGKHGH